MPSADAQANRLAIHVDALLLFGDRGNRLDGNGQNDGLTAGNSTQNAPAVIGGGIAGMPGVSSGKQGVVILAAQGASRRESVANLHSLDCADAHERHGQYGIQSVEDRLTESGGHVEGLYPDYATHGISISPHGTDKIIPGFHYLVAWSAIRTPKRLVPGFGGTFRSGYATEFQRVGPDANAGTRQQGASHRPAGHPCHGLTPRGTPSAAKITYSVFGVISHVRMTGPPDRCQRTVISGALVGVFNAEGNGSPRRSSLKNAGQQPNTVRFPTRRASLPRSGAASIQIHLDHLLGDGNPGRTTVDNAPERRAMRLSKRGQPEKPSKCIAAHAYSFPPAIRKPCPFPKLGRQDKRTFHPASTHGGPDKVLYRHGSATIETTVVQCKEKRWSRSASQRREIPGSKGTRMSNTVLTIGLAGLGTVGGGLVRLLSENKEELRSRTGCDIRLKSVAVRDISRPRDLPEGVRLTDNPMTLAEDPEIDVVIELMGGIDLAKQLIARSLENGKQIITANKALLAEEGSSLFRLAAEKKAALRYEASVAGGIPVVETLKESLTGNRISSLEGILNGTGNYILSEMTSKGRDFSAALADAQEKGFAEADPTLDIDGYDTAHKLVLLIRLAWGVDYPYTEMPIRGIRNLDRMDIEFAREFGYRIKLLGRAKMRNGRLEAGVFPTLVNHTYLLARVGGAFNAVRLEGNAVGTLFLHGLGAGSLPTASAVLGDLVSIARGNNRFNSGFYQQVLPRADILPPDQASSTYYMRFMVKDDSGVLRDLAGALSDQGVSIAQAIQKGQSEGAVPLVFMTHEASVHAVDKAIEHMRKADFLLAPAICYRVMG